MMNYSALHERLGIEDEEEGRRKGDPDLSLYFSVGGGMKENT